MTIGTLRMPRMGETMEEGKIVDWLVKPGQPFKRGQEILEVETDKTIVEYPALGDGTIVETLIELGEQVPVGTPIARVDVGDNPDWTDDGSGHDDAGAQVEPGAAQDTELEPTVAVMPQGEVSAVPAGLVRATPLARRIARQKGIDLASVPGSGRRGRVERADVERAGDVPGDAPSVAGVAYLEKGPANGEPLVLLHGFGADHAAWGGVQSRLALVGRRTIAVDLPGHGATAHDARHPDQLYGPIDRAMTELGLGPVHLVAHSMGAIPAVGLARARAVKSLTLIAPAGLGYGIDAEFLTGVARAESAGELSHLLARTTEGPHGLSSAILDRILSQLARRRLTALAETLVGGQGQAISIRSELALLAERMAVHLVVGHRDRILDWREMVGVSPRIAVHHLPRAGHVPHWEALAEVSGIITDITR